MAAQAESAALSAFREGHARLVELFNAGDFERAGATLRDDYVQIFPPGFTQSELRGRDAWIEFYSRFPIRGWRIDPFEYEELGRGLFLVGVDNSGVGESSGLPAAHRLWDLVEIDADGRAWRTREFFDRDEALAAASDQDPEESGP